MLICSLTKDDSTAFKNLLPEEPMRNVGTAGYFTIAALDDEGFPLGTLQFFVDGDPQNIFTSSLVWIYVIPEARHESIAWQLHDSYRQTLFDSKIPVSVADCGADVAPSIRDFFLALGYKSLGEGKFILNIPVT